MSIAAVGTRGDAPSSDQLLYNYTWCHPHLYISTFLGCVCSVPFSCGVCSGISIQSMCLMHHLLDTHLGFVVACGVQIAGAETTAPICECKCMYTLDMSATVMYLTFTLQTYHHLDHRFRKWPTQMTSHLHTQTRVQQRNTYSHTFIKFLPGQNITIFH